MSEVHQVGEARRELQPNGFDPGADTLEGQTRPQRHKDVQPIPTAGLGIVSYSCLLKYVVEPQRRLPQGIERRRLAGIQIEDSRCDLVLPPRAEKFEIKPLTLEQAYQLLEVARGHRLEALFALALATGMRRGELLALKWQDINFSTGTLQIRRILTRVPSKMPGKGYVESEPKTQKSRRSIVIAPFALDALKQHRIHQLEAKLRAGSLWQDHDYVFSTSVGTHLNPSKDVLDQLKVLLKKAGLPAIRFHDLRHSAATLLFSEGVHPKIVQELLGHSNISMTMDVYSHVLPSMQQDAISRLNSALGKVPRGESKDAQA